MSAVEPAERRVAPTPSIRPPESRSAAGEPTADRPTTSRPRKRRPPVAFLLVLLVLICVGGAFGWRWWIHAQHFETTDDAFIDGHVISISPQIAARVATVHVLDNQIVKAGDVLVELDPADYQAALNQRLANVVAMQGKLAEAKVEVVVAHANVGEAQAELVVAQANAANADQDYDRFSGLDPRARSQQQMDNATMAQRSDAALVAQAKAKVTAAQASLLSAQAAVTTAQANVATAQTDVETAKIQVGYTTIVAPTDGLITRKNLEVGMYVTAGQPLFAIVPTDVWVTANFKETQLDHMRVGQPVTIWVDAYPDVQFHGTVQSIQNGTGSRFSVLPPENATGNFVKVVQRVPVKIVFDPNQVYDPNHLLAPGMSVEPEVKVR
jgi:membrane fusion protein, multidrug efflux system